MRLHWCTALLLLQSKDQYRQTDTSSKLFTANPLSPVAPDIQGRSCIIGIEIYRLLCAKMFSCQLAGQDDSFVRVSQRRIHLHRSIGIAVIGWQVQETSAVIAMYARGYLLSSPTMADD